MCCLCLLSRPFRSTSENHQSSRIAQFTLTYSLQSFWCHLFPQQQYTVISLGASLQVCESFFIHEGLSLACSSPFLHSLWVTSPFTSHEHLQADLQICSMLVFHCQQKAAVAVLPSGTSNVILADFNYWWL